MKLRIPMILLFFVCLISCDKTNEELPIPYDISGSVLNNIGEGIKDVKLYYTPEDFMLSDADGNWSISSLIGEHTIIPEKEDYFFSPGQFAVISANNAIQFEASRIMSENETKVVNWFHNLQLDNGLLESSENSNFVSLYDNALSALVFLSYGEFRRAKRVFDFFNGRIDSELLAGNGGFSQFRDRDGNPNNHRWMGDNAWLLIALNNYKGLTGSDTYNRLSEEIENWLRSLQDSDGGLWGGFDVDNNQIGKITEGNIDAFNAILGYTDFHSNLLNYLENERWDPVDKNLVAWPGNIQYRHALDLHAWSYCIFEDYPLSSLTSAERYLTTNTSTVTGEQVYGYCFDIDRDCIWLEGTGEMIVAFQEANVNDQANYYLLELEKNLIESNSFADSSGIPYATNRGTGYGALQLWEGADINPAVSSGAWYLFAKNSFNPLATGKMKNIPNVDKFWIN